MVLHVFTSFLGGVPLCIPYGCIVDFTRRDHTGNPRGISESGPIKWNHPKWATLHLSAYAMLQNKHTFK